MKRPDILRDESCAEAYEYFDLAVRQLPKTSEGKVDVRAIGVFQHNDVDAFRHAYVSGVFTQEYGETAADIFGRINEVSPPDLYSNSNNPRGRNMDLWNNAIGRKYGLEAKDRKSLLKMIHGSLKAGELIIDPGDHRQYEGASNDNDNSSRRVIVLKQNEKGRNELFYDTEKRLLLSCEEFVVLIHSGKYPDYTVKEINGLPTPVSKRDSRSTNNLG